jgi:hypothetical protein
VPFVPGPVVKGVAPRQVREQPGQSEPLPRRDLDLVVMQRIM